LFVLRPTREIRTLIAGPAAVIYDDCVQLTQQLLDTGEHRLAITRLNSHQRQAPGSDLPDPAEIVSTDRLTDIVWTGIVISSAARQSM
jgi:ATP-dependent protease Clp ATPase subunit